MTNRRFTWIIERQGTASVHPEIRRAVPNRDPELWAVAPEVPQLLDAVGNGRSSRARSLWRAVRGICFFLALVALPGVSVVAQEPALARPKILGISHVRIRVSDFCKGKKFYTKVLDERPFCPDDKKPIGGSIALRSSQFITLNVHSLYAKSPLQPPSLLEEVGFVTDDAAGLRRYLTSRNIPIAEAGGRHPSFIVRDPEGHRIAFLERSTTQAQYRSDLALQPRIIHAGFVVRDRAAMDLFYKDMLGFHVYWHGGMKEGEDHWVDMQVPDGTDWLEYMLNVAPNADQHTLGVMNHIALGVPDIHAAEKQLRANGWNGTEQPKIGRDGKWQLNLYDPDDTRVELMEFTPTQKPCCSDYTGPHPKP